MIDEIRLELLEKARDQGLIPDPNLSLKKNAEQRMKMFFFLLPTAVMRSSSTHHIPDVSVNC